LICGYTSAISSCSILILSPKTCLKEVIMDIRDATSLFRYYQQSTRRKRTRESYRYLLQHLESLFGDRELDSIKPDEIYHFLENIMRESEPLQCSSAFQDIQDAEAGAEDDPRERTRR
jgi:hypothetical protein